MEFKHFLKKWRFNQNSIATKLGLTSGGFANKLSDKNADKLTDKQKEEIKEFFEELKKDIDTIQF